MDATHLALQRSKRNAKFARSLLISSTPPTTVDPEIEQISIGPMNYIGYSSFMLKELHKYVETSHALVVQADGFVINPERWQAGWLEYDYIGAPLPPIVRAGKYSIELKNRVGNGGFSLRSRRLMELVAPIDLETMRYPTRNEDMIISHLLYDYLTGRGMRFADLESAADFAIDDAKHRLGRTLATTFGFHGKHNLPEVEARMNGPARAFPEA